MRSFGAMPGLRAAIMVAAGALLIFSLSGRVCASDAGGRGQPGQETFIASTDKPFGLLMTEAMGVMHRGMAEAVRDGDPDHDFVAMMVPHHQGAIDMAKVELLYGRDREMRNLAQGIISSQQNEIALMRGWLLKYRKAPSGRDGTLEGVLDRTMKEMHESMQGAKRTGDPDRDFVALMAPHHEAAVAMARALLSRGKDEALRRLAQEIVTEQEYELRLMAAWMRGRSSAGVKPQDRVYTADQISNTVSVISPDTNTLLGQIRLGNVRPDVLSPLYRGEVNVHGLGFSPDHRTLIAVSTGSNGVTFIDAATNRVKGTAYVGRSPHEGFFTPDGKEVWVVVRGEDYISVIDPQTYRETDRILTTNGPGMVIFDPAGRFAYVCNSFNPVFEVIDRESKKVVKRLEVASPFSPYLVMTPDRKEIWLTHKDVGKVSRIDAVGLKVISVFDTGFITNHVHFGRTHEGVFAYVTVGGENVVKVFTTGPEAKLLASIPVGALPHGIWASDDGSRIYVGLENSDAVDVIDTGKNAVIARIPVGQAPQALVYVSDAVPEGDGRENLAPRPQMPEAINIRLAPALGDASGFVVMRNLGLVDAFEVGLFRLKPDTVYSVYLGEKKEPVALLRTNNKGAANVSTIGPIRQAAPAGEEAGSARIIVMEGYAPPDQAKAALSGG